MFKKLYCYGKPTKNVTYWVKDSFIHPHCCFKDGLKLKFQVSQPRNRCFQKGRWKQNEHGFMYYFFTLTLFKIDFVGKNISRPSKLLLAKSSHAQKAEGKQLCTNYTDPKLQNLFFRSTRKFITAMYQLLGFSKARLSKIYLFNFNFNSSGSLLAL